MPRKGQFSDKYPEVPGETARDRSTRIARLRNKANPDYKLQRQMQSASYWDENKEKISERNRGWRERNKEKLAAKSKEKRATESLDPDNQKDRRLRYRYGLSLDDFNKRKEDQEGCCAICGEPPTPTDSHPDLVVDHCHNTNQVRSLLCNSCNVGLGKFRDNPFLMLDASAYLFAHQSLQELNSNA